MKITVAPEPFDSADAQGLIAALDAHLAGLYFGGVIAGRKPDFCIRKRMMEPTPGFEPGTFSLPRNCSASRSTGRAGRSCVRTNGYKMVTKWLHAAVDMYGRSADLYSQIGSGVDLR